MSDYRHMFFSSILHIPRKQWDTIWPFPSEGYDFYLSQETANIADFEFSYLVIYNNDAVALIAPIFITDFNFHLAMEGIVQRAVKSIQRAWPNFLVVKTLFCGSFVSDKGVIAIHPDLQKDDALFGVFDRALLEYAKTHGAKMVNLKDLEGPDVMIFKPLLKLGYAKSAALPMATLPINFKSLEEYLAQLSHSTRKDLRRKIKRTDALGGFEVQEVNNVDPFIDDIYRLYLNVHIKNDGHFGLLTKEFFINFCTNMPNETIFFLYWIKNGEGKRLIAFNFCLNRGDSLIDKFIGLDYVYSYDYNIYFMSFLENVKWCLAHNKKAYVLNQGAYDIKKSLGATMSPMDHMSKMVNPFINKIAVFFRGQSI